MSTQIAHRLEQPETAQLFPLTRHPASNVGAFSLGCFIIILFGAGLKLMLAALIPASATFADDYNALNRAIYYSEGMLTSGGSYPFAEMSAGLIYFLLIAPWVLFDQADRIFFPFAINIALGAGTALFGSYIINRLIGKKALLPALVLTLLGPVFLFSFYVMTENLLFFLLAACGALVLELERIHQKPLKLASLCAVLALLPLTRAPGFAALPAVLGVLLMNARSIGWRRSGMLGALFLACTVGPYFGYLSLFGAAREGEYSELLIRALTDKSTYLRLSTLLLSQLGYIWFAGGCLLAPLALLGVVSSHLVNEEVRTIWKNYFCFMLLASAVFVGFCMVHLIWKMIFTDNAEYLRMSWFPYGRYNDPALLLLAIGGLATLLRREITLRMPLHIALWYVLVPAISIVALYSFSRTYWVPVNQSGTSIFALSRKGVPPEMLLTAAILIAAVSWTVVRYKARVIACSLFLIVFCGATSLQGMRYTVARSERAGYSLEAAKWINANTDDKTAICYDWEVINERAPMGVKAMSNVYRAMMFETYPRPFLKAGGKYGMDQCTMLYTLRRRIAELNWDVAWKNGHYAVLRPVQKQPAAAAR